MIGLSCFIRRAGDEAFFTDDGNYLSVEGFQALFEGLTVCLLNLKPFAQENQTFH
jgi:hypothetical protein